MPLLLLVPAALAALAIADTVADLVVAAEDLGTYAGSPCPENAFWAAYSFGATLVPGVPGWAGKLYRGARAADKAGQAADKAARLARNKAAGDAAERHFEQEAKAAGLDVRRTTEYIKNKKTGQRRKPDFELYEGGQRVGYVEVKTPTARYPRRQREFDEEWNGSGGAPIVVWRPGMPLP